MNYVSALKKQDRAEVSISRVRQRKNLVAKSFAKHKMLRDYLRKSLIDRQMQYRSLEISPEHLMLIYTILDKIITKEHIHFLGERWTAYDFASDRWVDYDSNDLVPMLFNEAREIIEYESDSSTINRNISKASREAYKDYDRKTENYIQYGRERLIKKLCDLRKAQEKFDDA